MKYLLLCMLLIGCDKITPPSEQLIKARAEEQARYDKGPKFKGMHCYKVINPKSYVYGCSFFSEQGEMFLTTHSEQRRSYRDSNEEGDAISDPAQWVIIWNHKIRCLGTEHGPAIPENDAKIIKCPEELYK